MHLDQISFPDCGTQRGIRNLGHTAVTFRSTQAQLESRQECGHLTVENLCDPKIGWRFSADLPNERMGVKTWLEL